MNRSEASQLCRDLLKEYNLSGWHVVLNIDSRVRFLGLCDHSSKTIILNAIAIDVHPNVEVIDTIRHEVAHAIVGAGYGHSQTWMDKAIELGATPVACSSMGIPERVLDAIRSGHNVEVTVEEKTHVIRTPTYKVTRLQEKCPDCGKVAIEKFSCVIVDKAGNQVKMITLDCFHIIKKIIPRDTPFETMVSNDWKPEVKNCAHDWNKNQCKVCLEFRLFNFQVTGARFTEAALSMSKGALIADDMGLGKTVQALAILRFHGAKKYTKTMIVTKSAIKFQWFKQAVRWLGPEYIAQVISTSKDYLFPNLKLYIIPYDLLRRMKREKLHALGINLVILDEVQQIKNPDSTRTQEVRKLVSANPDCKVIELSGTPWKNRGSEFFAALNLIDPVKFYSYQHYLDTWVEYYFEGSKKKMGGIRNIKKFKEFTESIVIRREYNEVMDEFPDINRMKLPIQLDDLNQSAYDDATSDFVAWYNEAVIGGEEDALNGLELLAKMARMRHITGLAKIPGTLTFVEEFIEDTDKKIVVFVHHKDVGQLMYDAMKNTSKESNVDWSDLATKLADEGVKVFKYTSDLSDVERYNMQEEFNKTPRCVMIASTLACGEGVDLQTCADSILHERQWNPQNEDQATPGRFRRIGQTSKVINITCPEGEGTIDEELNFIVERKRAQFHSAMNKGDAPVWNEGAIAKELAEAIVKRHNAKNKGTKSKALASVKR